MDERVIRMEESSHLIEFFGEECSHCRSVEPLIARLQDEEGVTVQRLEVWHNEENAKLTYARNALTYHKLIVEVRALMDQL